MKRDLRLSQYKQWFGLGNRSVKMTKPNSLRRGYDIRPRYHSAGGAVSHGLFFGPTSFAAFYKGEGTPPSFNWKPTVEVPFVSSSYAHYRGS